MTDPGDPCPLAVLQLLGGGITHGEEPGEIVARYLEALAQSGRIIGAGHDVALEMLARALRRDKALAMKLAVGRAKPGKPIAKEVRAKAGRGAAALATRLMAEGWSTEAAVAQAAKEKSISRSEVFEWLRSNRRWLEYAAGRPGREGAAIAREMFLAGAPLADAVKIAARETGLEQADILRWLEPEARLRELKAERAARAAIIRGLFG